MSGITRKTVHSTSNNIDIHLVYDALEAFIRDQTDVSWQHFLDAISAVTGNSSTIDGAKEVRKPRAGHRRNGQRDRLLPRPAVEVMVGLKKTTIYELVKQKRFPAPVKIGKATRWKASEVSEWIADRDRGAPIST